MSSCSEIKKQALKKVKGAKNLKELDRVYKRYLGGKGEVFLVLKNLKDFSENKRKEIGKEINLVKKDIEEAIKEKQEALKEIAINEIIEKDKLDITIPGKKIKKGHLHPITLTLRKIQEIFQNMGFSIIEGPEVETEWYNFDALNIPKDHPARDAWDTFWLQGNEKLLLRTHTSPVQIRYMEKNQPPFRIIVPGRVFRHEATDASHEINFYHLEGLMIDKQISMANFKAVMEHFLKSFFGKKIKMRLRPSFFPFTEPSFEIDISCVACGGKGCSVCKKTGWLETMGAGMVHPNVLKAGGLNPKDWQGFAFGMGVDRLIMMKHKINDIRLFYNNDLRFLKQF
ncbi:phenylalanine--tRNA ligase subunit alpha [Candidatus Parcubacteria bacterium]|nr:phenylalanine--tRNA ligase subunit alpha [Candidatus Parcubacteria bacterium]